AQKQPARAFEVVERSRARSLLEILAAAHIDIHQGVDPELVKQEHSLQALINAKSSRRVQLLGSKHVEGQVTSLDSEIDKLLSGYKDLEEQIRVRSPGYAALPQPQPLRAGEVQQQLLDPDTVLLEYSLGEQRSYVFVLTPDSLAAHELPKR